MNEIIVRACQSNPARRYASAQELRGDLTVLVYGKSVRRLRMLERRMVRLTRVAAGAAAVLIAGALVFSQVDRERRRNAEQHQRQVGALVANGTRALDAGDLLGGLPSLVRALRLDAGTERDRTHRLRIHSLLASSPKLTQFWRVEGGVESAALNETGDALAATHFDGTLSLWRLSDARPPERIANAVGHNVAFHSGAKRLALVNGNEIQIWQLDPPQAIFALRHSNMVNSVSFNGDGSQFIAAYDDHTARIWTTATGAAGQVFQGHTAGVTHACFSADGRLVATSSRDGTARLWHAADARPALPPLWHGSWVYHVAFSPDGELVATADYEHQAHIWSATTGRRTVSPLQHGDMVRTVRFSPDNRYLLTGSWDSTARLWLVETGYPVALNPVLHHTHRVMYAAFTRNGRQIATACQDGTVRVWDLAGAMEPRPRIVDRFSRTGDRAFVISNDMVQVFDRLTQHAVSKPFCLGEAPKSAFLSDDGAYLTTFHDAGPARSVPEAQVWAVASGRPWGAPVRPLRHSDYAVISDRGEYLATLISNVVTIHSLHDRNRAPVILSETNTRHFAWSPDARRLATVGNDCICLWDPATGRPAAPDMQHPKADKVEFSKSGETLASWALDSGLSECYAQVWHTATGERRGAPLRHRDGIQDLAFSPDGKRLITASEDHTAVIWDLATSAPAVPPLKHRKQVAAVGFSRHGQWVFTAGRDGAARLWDTQTGEPITPWLIHPPPLWDGRFLRNDDEFFVIGDFRQGWLWNLQLELRSAGDLTRLSQLLAAEGEVNPREIELIWQQMRAAHPEDFVASRAEITAWHEQESLSAEREQKWPQALFHLKQLQQLEPDNAHWLERHKAVGDRATAGD